MDKCREEFEKQRCWIGLFRTGVDFDVTLGEFGRYIANGTKRTDAMDLESFNEKWEAWANAWQNQQAKVEELQNNINLLNEALDIKEQLNQKLRGREDELQKQLSEYIFVAETLDEMYVKEVQKSDELQKRVDAAKYYMKNIFSGVAEVDQCHLGDLLDILDGEIVDELEQALKGDQYDEHRKKAEEAISKGASLTNHRIEL